MMNWMLPVIIALTIILIIIGIQYRDNIRSFIFNLFNHHSTVIEPSQLIPQKYAPQVLKHLVLPDTVKGVVGIRQWTWIDTVLTSRNNKYTWTSAKMTADKIPTKNNRNGIYAYQLGSAIPSCPHHIGIVEMLEHIEVHSDGVLRAEKCKILVLIVNWGNGRWAKEVSSRYSIPIFIGNYPDQVFKEWLLGSDGIKWLNHNYNLIYAPRYKILEEVEKLLGEKP